MRKSASNVEYIMLIKRRTGAINAPGFCSCWICSPSVSNSCVLFTREGAIKVVLSVGNMRTPGNRARWNVRKMVVINRSLSTSCGSFSAISSSVEVYMKRLLSPPFFCQPNKVLPLRCPTDILVLIGVSRICSKNSLFLSAKSIETFRLTKGTRSVFMYIRYCQKREKSLDFFASVRYNLIVRLIKYSELGTRNVDGAHAESC